MAIPTYAMSCYLIPKGMIMRINQAFSSFWWKNQHTGRGIHWQSWDKLTRHKFDGGLSFRDLEGFNLALLGKQLWRLCRNPSSVLGRLLKGKYFASSSSILHAKLGNRPSFGWRSILASRELLSKGLKRELGNGLDTSLSSDPWVVENKFPRPPRPHVGVNLEDLSMNMLRVPYRADWNVFELQRLFPASEVELILQNFPGTQDSIDSFSWTHTSSGLYSVKSGYWLWNSILSANKKAPEFGPNFSELYRKIWSLDANPKIRNFIWRCISNILPVGSELFRKRLRSDASCQICGNTKEDIRHLLFNCTLSKSVWALSPYTCLANVRDDQSIYELLDLCLNISASQSTMEVTAWPWIFWHIWKARNEFCFDGTQPNSVLINTKAGVDANDWRLHNKSDSPAAVPILDSSSTSTVATSSVVYPSESSRQWSPPPDNFLKCNVDASWQDDKDKCGVAWLLRDSRGSVVYHGYKAFPKSRTVLEAEAMALTWAVHCVWDLHLDNILFESDSKTTIQAIMSLTNWPCLHGFTSSIDGVIRRRAWNATFHHIRREANMEADSLAKLALFSSLYVGIIRSGTPLF